MRYIDESPARHHHIIRTFHAAHPARPDTIITVAIVPIALMLLFVYVFGGAINAGTDNYVNYMLPGILLIAIASGISYTAIRIFTDTQKGIVSRCNSMPVARPSVLWGHVLTSLASNAISLANIILIAQLMGFPSNQTSQCGLPRSASSLCFTLALTWLAGKSFLIGGDLAAECHLTRASIPHHREMALIRWHSEPGQPRVPDAGS